VKKSLVLPFEEVYNEVYLYPIPESPDSIPSRLPPSNWFPCFFLPRRGISRGRRIKCVHFLPVLPLSQPSLASLRLAHPDKKSRSGFGIFSSSWLSISCGNVANDFSSFFFEDHQSLSPLESFVFTTLLPIKVLRPYGIRRSFPFLLCRSIKKTLSSRFPQSTRSLLLFSLPLPGWVFPSLPSESNAWEVTLPPFRPFPIVRA